MSMTASDALRAYLDRHPGFDIHTFDGTLSGVADEEEEALILAALRRAAALRHALPDPLLAYAVSLAGFTSLHALAGASTERLIAALAGVLPAARARALQADARGALTRLLMAWMRKRESVSPHRRALEGPGSGASTRTTLPHYATLFGQAPVQDIPETASILGPGAYFTDLMSLIDEEIVRLNPGVPDALTLRARRPDLWNLPLTEANATDPVSQAELGREILESTLLQLAPSFTLLNQSTQRDAAFPANIRSCSTYQQLADAVADPTVDRILLPVDITLTSDNATLVVTHALRIQGVAPRVTLITAGQMVFSVRSTKLEIDGVGFSNLSGAPAIELNSGALTLENTVFARSGQSGLVEGWAIRSFGGEALIRSCTFYDPASLPGPIFGRAGGSTTLSIFNSILHTVTPIESSRVLFPINAPTFVSNIAWSNVSGGDPKQNTVVYDGSNFSADPRFVVDPVGGVELRRLSNDSPCVGRGARGAQVGASVYDVYAVIARAIYPIDMPFDVEAQSAVKALDGIDLSLPVIYEAFSPFGATGAFGDSSALGLGLGDVQVLTTPVTDPAVLAPYFGLKVTGRATTGFDAHNVVLTREDTTNLRYNFRAEEFARWMGLNPIGLRELLYQDLSPAEIRAGVQRGAAPWAEVPTQNPWRGFFINAGQSAAFALEECYAPAARGYLSFGTQAMHAVLYAREVGRGSFTLTQWCYLHAHRHFMQAGQTRERTARWLRWTADLHGTLEISIGKDSTGTSNWSTLLRLPGVLPVARWTHLATVCDTSLDELIVYVNGERVGSAPFSRNTDPVFDVVGQGSIYLNSSGSPSGLVAFADVALWREALSSAQLASSFRTLPVPLPFDPATAPANVSNYWPLADALTSTSTVNLLWNACATTRGDIVGWGPGVPGPGPWGAAYLPELRGELRVNLPRTVGGCAFVQEKLLTGEAGGARASLSVASLDRLNRFVRLARRLGMRFAELDWALYTLRCPSIDGLPVGQSGSSGAQRTFAQLSLLRQIQRRSGMSVDEVCSTLGPLRPFGRGAEEDRPTRFDEVFNRPPLAGVRFTPEMAQPLTIPRDDSPGWGLDSMLFRRIAGCLGLSTAELRRVATLLAPQPPADAVLTLNWVTLSSLFRFRALSAALRLGVEPLIELLSFAEVSVNAGLMEPATLLGLIRDRLRLEMANTTPAKLCLLVANPGTVHPEEDPLQRSLDQRFRVGLPALSAGLRRALQPSCVGPESFVRPGIDAAESSAYFEGCVQDELVTPTGVARPKLLGMCPELAVRVPSEYPTLQAAADAALELLNGGATSALVLVGPGVYTGEGNVGLSLSLERHQGTLILASEAGAESTFIQDATTGQPRSGPMWSIRGDDGDAALIIEGFTLRDTRPPTPSLPSDVEGLLELRSIRKVSLRGCRLLEGRSSKGGALTCEHVNADGELRTLSVENCVLAGNESAGGGGAIWAEFPEGSTATVEIGACTFFKNKAGTASQDDLALSSCAVSIDSCILVVPPELHAVVSYTFESADPALVQPEEGNFALGPDAAGKGTGRGGADPGYLTDLASSFSLLYGAALTQLDILRTVLVGFLECGELPLNPILRYLTPYSSGLEILTSAYAEDSREAGVAYLRQLYLYLTLAAELGFGAAEMRELLGNRVVFLQPRATPPTPTGRRAPGCPFRRSCGLWPVTPTWWGATPAARRLCCACCATPARAARPSPLHRRR